jgi:hypothetical protein
MNDDPAPILGLGQALNASVKIDAIENANINCGAPPHQGAPPTCDLHSVESPPICSATIWGPTESEKALASTFAANGFLQIDPSFLTGRGGSVAESRRKFLESIRRLPPDWECAAKNRFRRYGVFAYRPWDDDSSCLPPEWDAERGEHVVEYWQPPNVNPEYAGKRRLFAALTESQRNSLFLKDAIGACFRVAPWTESRKPIWVGVHVVRQVATSLLASTVSPNHLHLDGERFTFGFLLERSGVIGGENFIAPRKFANLHPTEVAPHVLQQFTLENQFAGWAVDDLRVCHHANGIGVAEGCEIAVRTMLLIDLCVSIPLRVS